jgi:hypothetical protein
VGPTEARFPGGLSVLGQHGRGPGRIAAGDVPRLGIEALLEAEATAPFGMADVFDAAEKRPRWLRLEGDQTRPRRRGEYPDAHIVSWGFTIWPAGPDRAEYRANVLSRL